MSSSLITTEHRNGNEYLTWNDSSDNLGLFQNNESEFGVSQHQNFTDQFLRQAKDKGIVSNDIRHIIDLVVGVILGGVISVLGIITNILCILVFAKQGLKENVNISLLGLAVADLCCMIIMLWGAILHAVRLSNPPPFLFEPFNFLVMTSSYPRLIFTRITSWMTAFISIKRCACVVFPFEVKTIFTPTKTWILTTAIFVTVLSSYMFIYYTRALALTFNPDLNMTQYMIVVFEDRSDRATEIISTILFVFIPLLNLFIIILCTLLLTLKLKSTQKWRSKIVTSALETTRVQGSGRKRSIQDKPEVKKRETIQNMNEKRKTPKKETKVNKMVLTIMAMFIICNTPSNLLLSMSAYIPGFNTGGQFVNLFVCVHDVAFLLETINSSVSLLVYYLMSSKFKLELKSMFNPVTAHR